MSDSKSIDAFRADTRAWLEANCPAEMRAPITAEADICWGGRNAQFSCAAQKAWLDRMAERGWTAPTWPREYGGAGLSPDEAQALAEEMRALNCRLPLASFGLWMLGPALLKFGDEAQKREHLPKIARGETRWCQGYSEPGAGSDLASLQTYAQDCGDHFIVNGQKIWTSFADKCDWIFCLARTDRAARKQAGISFVLFDMASAGVSTKPIELISGKSTFCEIFFDNVRVDKANLVGAAGRGWDVAKYLLAHERMLTREREMIGAAGERIANQALGATAAERIGLNDSGCLDAPLLRARIAEFETDESAFRALSEQFGASADARLAHPAFPSALKYYGAELNKRRHELSMDVGGVDALEWEGAASNQGSMARNWLRSKANSIGGGTSEIQLNIIAKRILGLPGN
ncbi:MAG TPA: acyl-CoA dehydrogenase family protein [Ramlibacter sp.]|nr:acyl-CoA dehydrogenase family protein [Ramlibacter sp.]